MAEDTVVYKVQLDDSDLSSQLANVRGQIDSSMGQAFAGSTLPQMGADRELPGFFNRA